MVVRRCGRVTLMKVTSKGRGRAAAEKEGSENSGGESKGGF